MDFSEALLFVKNGAKIQRAGWNGKGMYLYLVETSLPVRFDGPGEAVADWKHPYGDSRFIVMKTADDKLVPWLASQADVLAEDWQVL